jgi:hypothetical protein
MQWWRRGRWGRKIFQTGRGRGGEWQKGVTRDGPMGYVNKQTAAHMYTCTSTRVQIRQTKIFPHPLRSQEFVMPIEIFTVSIRIRYAYRNSLWKPDNAIPFGLVPSCPTDGYKIPYICLQKSPTPTRIRYAYGDSLSIHIPYLRCLRKSPSLQRFSMPICFTYHTSLYL